VGEQKGKSERTKVYIIIGLGIVFCLVGYYRFFYHRPPGQAAAPAVAPSPTVAQEVAGVAVRPREAGVVEPAGREVAGEAVRDIFEAPRSFKTGDGKSEGADIAPAARAPLVLNGMILSEGNALAIINGHFQRVGDQVGGYRIVRIGSGDVLLRGEDQEITLRVIDYGQK
jgi:hypothetical protein